MPGCHYKALSFEQDNKERYCCTVCCLLFRSNRYLNILSIKSSQILNQDFDKFCGMISDKFYIDTFK